ncbi:hypothetical protein [Protofrankia symbiont of Coriaria ruscifolia]|uniref:hypothetical protein n=1 Tax=Protofrankia symbiont of Coriaria ruscifolia TaxID=1306542 RepID=UPI001041B285|nr:hypothetical protein [Protofrankia symbiont of Coriaria ruscifolia]
MRRGRAEVPGPPQGQRQHDHVSFALPAAQVSWLAQGQRQRDHVSFALPAAQVPGLLREHPR